MEKKDLLYEGKAKKVYRTDDPEVLYIAYKAVSYTHLQQSYGIGDLHSFRL